MSSADAGVLQRQKAKVKRQKSVPVLLFTFALTAERSHSGLVHRSRKPEWLYGHRGFESHPLRHVLADCQLMVADWLFVRTELASELINRQSKIGNPGKVQEWFNWQHWKCCERGTVPWVRIPPFPP